MVMAIILSMPHAMSCMVLAITYVRSLRTQAAVWSCVQCLICGRLGWTGGSGSQGVMASQGSCTSHLASRANQGNDMYSYV